MCEGKTAEGATSRWTLDDLTKAERALLGSMRGWRTASRPGSGLGVVQHAVKGAGLPLTTVLPLASLLGILDLASANDRPNLRCFQCRKVTEDEALLLDAVAAAQWGRDDVVAAMLEPWFRHGPPAKIACGRLCELATVLAEADAWFPGERTDLFPPMLAAAAE